jgi:hypothetical protein
VVLTDLVALGPRSGQRDSMNRHPRRMRQTRVLAS